MNLSPMMYFLSEANLQSHLMHLREQKLKLSIYEKSLPQIRNKSISEISKLRLGKQEKQEISHLLWYIRSHELFFDSFAERVEIKPNPKINQLYFDIYTDAMKFSHGFLYVFSDSYGKPNISISTSYNDDFLKNNQAVCIDLYEHTYFGDYGFKKEKFIKNMLPYLNLKRLSLNA